MLSASTLPSILLPADPRSTCPCSPRKQRAPLDSPASHVTLSKSLPSELPLPACDVQVTAFGALGRLPPWEVQRPCPVALLVA